MRSGKPWSVLHYSCLFSVVLTLTSCSFLKYPVGMPALVTTETSTGPCPPIAGRYSDAGTEFSEDGATLGSASLAHLIHSAYPSADVVIVRGPERDVIEIESFKGQTSVAILNQQKRTVFGLEGYVCVPGGFLVLDSHQGGQAFGLIGTYSNNSLFLHKSTDGSLIVYQYEAEGSLLFVVPTWSSKGAWYSFPPAAQQ